LTPQKAGRELRTFSCPVEADPNSKRGYPVQVGGRINRRGREEGERNKQSFRTHRDS